jgi:hypothetical protein
MVQLLGKQIDGHAPEREPLAAPCRRLGTGGFQYPPADIEGECALGKCLVEVPRFEQSPYWMPPPQQGFCTGDAAVRQQDLRLIVEFELPAGKSVTQLPDERAARFGTGAHGRGEAAISAAAALLCLVEREIGIRQQLAYANAVQRCNRNSGTGAEMEHVIANHVGLRQPGQHRVDDF